MNYMDDTVTNHSKNKLITIKDGSKSDLSKQKNWLEDNKVSLILSGDISIFAYFLGAMVGQPAMATLLGHIHIKLCTNEDCEWNNNNGNDDYGNDDDDDDVYIG